jgi:regulator of sigma E protease
MAGEEEGELPKTKDMHPTEPHRDEAVEKPGLYDAPIYKRILIIFAGPLFNIASAVLVIIITFSIFGLAVDPYTTIEVEEMSLAEEAGFRDGDSVIAVNETPIETWDDFLDFISENINEEITITVMRENRELSINVVVDIDSLGITNLVPPILGPVKRGGPAYSSGMVEGDRVITVNNLEVHSWNRLVELVRESADSSLLVVWQHEGERKSAEVVAASRYDYVLQDTIKQIGVLKPHSRIYLPPGEVVILAVERTAGITWMTLNIFYQLIVGRISRRAVGGPIAIIQLTTESARWGFEYILSILIIISINLGLINLFPIPALDGGHIVIATIEAIRRKRFSKKTRILIQQIGYAIIFLLIIFVTFNDITR